MKGLLTAGALALVLGIGIAACSKDSPTAPTMSAPQSGDFRFGPQTRGEPLTFDVTGPMTNAAGQVVANFAGSMNVTKFGFDEAAHQLLVTGVLNGTATYVDGTTAPVTITNQVVTTTATLRKGTEVSSTSTPYQFASSIYHFTASCGILLLDLGPLHLDLLGLVVDLNEVILSITGQTGAGNLLGNLLCALTGILDIPGAIAGIINLISSINDLLSSIGGLATPTIGPAPLGGLHFSHGTVAVLRLT
jgi:hypothetical protein